MKSAWKPIKLGVPGNMRSICLPLGVPLNILPGYGGPSLKGHLCRLKVRLKRGKGGSEERNEKEQEAGIGDVRNIRKSERMPLLQRRNC